MEKCQCPKHGFCQYYKQEMTYDPPNWQWCQSATPEEREKYKLDCEKKHSREKEELDKFSQKVKPLSGTSPSPVVEVTINSLLISLSLKKGQF